MLHMPGPMLFNGGVPDPYFGAAIVLDFAGLKNSGQPLYRRDGVHYASASAMGFTGTGTFDAEGYTPLFAGDSLGMVVDAPGDYIVHARFSQPPTDTIRVLWMWEAAPAQRVQRGRTGNDGQYVFAAIVGSGPVAATQISAGLQFGVPVIAYDTGTVLPGVTAPNPPGSSVFRVGSFAGGSNQWAASIKLLSLHKATLTDAEIQALHT